MIRCVHKMCIRKMCRDGKGLRCCRELDLKKSFSPLSTQRITLLPEQMYPYLEDKAAEKKGGKNVTYFSRDLPYSFDFLVENFMDPA